MTKSELVKEISKRTGIEQATVSAVVESLLDTVRDAMIAQKNVYLRGFGTFQIKRRAEKLARNISKKVSIIIPAHNIPAFKPAKSFLEKVRGKK